MRAVVVGAGMGGLAAALALARAGWTITLLEAREAAGGLASGFEREGFGFDAGPYVLLDRPGLEWAFRELGLELNERVDLRRIAEVYEIGRPDGPPVCIYDDRERTADALERRWPGSGDRYRQWIGDLEGCYQRLAPLQRAAPGGPAAVLAAGGWRDVWFLLQPLGRILARSGLPRPVQEALGIWTHIAGQRLAEAPSPLAFVPALIHSVGAWLPVGGIRQVPAALAQAAVAAGVEIRYGARVHRITQSGGRVTGVELGTGERLTAGVVVSNAPGIATYLELLEECPSRIQQALRGLPLQSPGVCAYLSVEGNPGGPYLRFHLPGGDERCRLLISTAVPEPEAGREGWYPARLLVPMDHARAVAAGPAGQREYLERMLAEDWWRPAAPRFRVLDTQIPRGWGTAFHLFRDSMNPVMTARFMRRGRLPHRSPHVGGLYLAGSATHPGQWVSFCAISGLLAARAVLEDTS